MQTVENICVWMVVLVCDFSLYIDFHVTTLLSRSFSSSTWPALLLNWTWQKYFTHRTIHIHREKENKLYEYKIQTNIGTQLAAYCVTAMRARPTLIQNQWFSVVRCACYSVRAVKWALKNCVGGSKTIYFQLKPLITLEFVQLVRAAWTCLVGVYRFNIWSVVTYRKLVANKNTLYGEKELNCVFLCFFWCVLVFVCFFLVILILTFCVCELKSAVRLQSSSSASYIVAHLVYTRMIDRFAHHYSSSFDYDRSQIHNSKTAGGVVKQVNLFLELLSASEK